MIYGVGFVVGVIAVLLGTLGWDVIEQVLPKRLFEAILIVTVMIWVRWALKDTIKDAVIAALKENKDQSN